MSGFVRLIAMSMPFFAPMSIPRFSRLRTNAAALFLVVSTCGAASAMTLREVRALEVASKQGENYVNYYLVGVMEGAIEAHNQAVRANAKPTICLSGRRLEPRMARTLFDAELKRNAGVYEADMSVQLVLTNALKAEYHC